MSRSNLKPAAPYHAVVGAILSSLRARQGLLQPEMAAALEVSQSTWSRIERGGAAISLEQLCRAADKLGTRPSEVLRLADRATDHIEKNGIKVARVRPQDALSDGQVMIGAAALVLLVAAVFASKR